LEEQLLKEEPKRLAQEALQRGDPSRGAVLFFQPGLTCAKCHTSPGKEPMIGPDLTRLRERPSREDLVDSILRPSKAITKGYESITIVTKKGTRLTGLLVEERPDAVILRDAGKEFTPTTVSKTDIEERSTSPVSIMPAGLVNQLGTRQQFLDLVRYLMEITEKGRLVPASSSRTRRFSSLLRCRNTKRTSIMPASSKAGARKVSTAAGRSTIGFALIAMGAKIESAPCLRRFGFLRVRSRMVATPIACIRR